MTFDRRPTVPSLQSLGVPRPGEAPAKVKTSHTRHFYKSQPLRDLGEIRADIV